MNETCACGGTRLGEYIYGVRHLICDRCYQCLGCDVDLGYPNRGNRPPRVSAGS